MTKSHKKGPPEAAIFLAGALFLLLLFFYVLSSLFPAPSPDREISASSSYWRNTAPFALLHYDVTQDGNATLVVLNVDGNFSHLTITRIDIGTSSYAKPIMLTHGNFTTVEMKVNIVRGWFHDKKLRLNVNITYQNPDGTSSVQVGKNPLVTYDLPRLKKLT